MTITGVKLTGCQPFSLSFNLQLIELTGDWNPVKVNRWFYGNWQWCNAIFVNHMLIADITKGEK